MQPTAEELELPRELDDYVIGRELGRGATGRVYVAEDAMLARAVAIKLVARLDAGARQRFLLEARAVAQIHHPNVVGIYRVGTFANRPYFVAELVRGVSLAKVEKPMAWQDVLDIGIGLARGLAAAHRRNVVHCDLKPSNVMLDPDGVAKIIDFGLARIVADGASPGRQMPVGTPDYMAPEVWRGEAPSRRADVYSFGALLFELLTGAPPFADVPAPELKQRVTSSEAPPLVDTVDLALAAVVERCLRRDREERYADGDELREALERLHASRRHVVRAGENPYRGLLPFEASHRGLFFGRRSEVDAVVGRLRGESIVIVTGDSGVGKSSLCRAGVLPAVLDGELGGAWQALTLVPGPRPLTAFAAALGAPELALQLREAPARLARELRRFAGERSLIVFVDQLEELITLGEPSEVAALDAALAGLVDVPGLRVLATARADFLARLASLPELGRDLSRLLYFLRPLPPERLRDVIVGPAAAVGTRFETDAIVDELITATSEAGAGGLPLLSFALADLWEARGSDNVISRGAVAAMGGVAGALSRHADVVIGGMIASDRAVARRILLRLVTAMGTRARRDEHELVPDAASRGVLDALVKGRLVVVHDGETEPAYELVHECLLTGWTTLRRWLEADTAGRAMRERLAAAVAEWTRLGRPSDATWQGARLYEASALEPATLTDGERAFLAASRRIARNRRWARWLIIFGAVGLVALAFATQRYLARRELAAAVAGDMARAHIAHAAASLAERQRDGLTRDAFALFDRAARPSGGASANEDAQRAEAQWSAAVERRAAAEAAYRQATGYVELALARDPRRDDVRDLMGDLLLERAGLADAVHDRDQLAELLDRLPAYDADRHRRAAWLAPGLVTIHAPLDAVVSFEPQDKQAASAPVTPLTGSGTRVLVPGSYVLLVTAPGRLTVRAPIVVARNAQLTLELVAPYADPIWQDFVYVPEGEFLYGNANDEDRLTFFATTPLRQRRTDAFMIGRCEVTFGDWLTFVDSLPASERQARLPLVSAQLGGGVAVTPDGAGHWRIALQPADHVYSAGWGEPIHYQGRTKQVVQDWRRFPVLGVSAEDATAYAAWLARTGRVPTARLCDELEWERAARGADGRGYPANHSLAEGDANIDITHGREWMGPDEVGSHPASRSPFGLDDTAGNAFEWTRAEQGDFILRSGSYRHDRKTSHLTNRSPMRASARDATLGFRVCATPPLPR